MKTVFVLLADGDQTMHSKPMPFGVAVTSQEEAHRLAGGGYYSNYMELRIFENVESALMFKYPNYEKDLKKEKLAEELKMLRQFKRKFEIWDKQVK